MIKVNDPASWNEALAGIKHGFAHTWAYNQASALGADFAPTLFSCTHESNRVVCPLLVKSIDGYQDLAKPYGLGGFVGDGPIPGFSRMWHSFAEERGFISGYIGIHPILTDSSYYFPEDAETYNLTYVLDLTLSEDELISRMSRRRRQYVRKMEGGYADYVTDRSDLGAFLTENYPTFMASRGASRLHAYRRETLSRLLQLENVVMIGKALDEELQAAVLFGYTPYEAEYLAGVSVGDGKRFSTELMWAAVRQLKQLNVPRLNLGAGITPADGIATFKKRFGANELPLRRLKQIYRANVYKDLCRVRGVSEISGTFFPAYRRDELEGGLAR